jgi:mannose-6-phosphate isomerase-like protein (cupin superfamily)
MSITRREMCLLLPGLLPVAAEPYTFAQEKLFALRSVSVRQMHAANNNAHIRLMMRGKRATGKELEVHETTLPSRGAPTATTHLHPHTETWLIREGTTELTVSDKHYRPEPGSVGFVRSNEEHGIRSVGTTPALYFVVAVGPGAELQE